MRLLQLADIVEVFHRIDGTDSAVEVARARRGKQFDPAVVDAFCGVAPDVLGDASSDVDWETLIDEEPALQRRLNDHELDAALEAVGDFTDLRSPSRAGPPRGVADLAARAAADSGLSPADVVAVRRAGLLHDIGLHGGAPTILNKSGPLSSPGWEGMRIATYLPQRMLGPPALLARLGAHAA